MRDVFAHTSAWWGKYSGYVWKTAPDGHCYLHPAQNAKPGVYDPMKDSRSIVLDALELCSFLRYNNGELFVFQFYHHS